MRQNENIFIRLMCVYRISYIFNQLDKTNETFIIKQIYAGGTSGHSPDYVVQSKTYCKVKCTNVRLFIFDKDFNKLGT